MVSRSRASISAFRCSTSAIRVFSGGLVHPILNGMMPLTGLLDLWKRLAVGASLARAKSRFDGFDDKILSQRAWYDGGGDPGGRNANKSPDL